MSERILVVDDQEEIRELLADILQRRGSEPVMATCPEDALEMLSDDAEDFDLVILDLTIPGKKGGLETLTELKKIDPDVKAIVSSGYSEQIILSNYSEYGFIDKLPKPYIISEINDVISKYIK